MPGEILLYVYSRHRMHIMKVKRPILPEKLLLYFHSLLNQYNEQARRLLGVSENEK